VQALDMIHVGNVWQRLQLVEVGGKEKECANIVELSECCGDDGDGGECFCPVTYFISEDDAVRGRAVENIFQFQLLVKVVYTVGGSAVRRKICQLAVWLAPKSRARPLA